MTNLTEKILNFLASLPDTDFKFDYYSWSGRHKRQYEEARVSAYIQERSLKTMAPIVAKRGVNREAAAKRERELEKAIVSWAKKDGSIVEGMRVKFKGTRDDGYRKVVTFDKQSLQVVGYQFYYQRPWNNPKEELLCDTWATTSNHVSNIRQVIADNGKWVKIRDYLLWPNNYRKQT